MGAGTSESCEKRAKTSSRWNLKSWSGATRGMSVGSGGCEGCGGGGAPASRVGAVAKASGERSAVGEGGKRIRGGGRLRRRALLQATLLARRGSALLCSALLSSAPSRRRRRRRRSSRVVSSGRGTLQRTPRAACLTVYMLQPHAEAHGVFDLFVEGEGGIPTRYLFSNLLVSSS